MAGGRKKSRQTLRPAPTTSQNESQTLWSKAFAPISPVAIQSSQADRPVSASILSSMTATATDGKRSKAKGLDETSNRPAPQRNASIVDETHDDEDDSMPDLDASSSDDSPAALQSGINIRYTPMRNPKPHQASSNVLHTPVSLHDHH